MMSDMKVSRAPAPASPTAACAPEGSGAVDAWLRLVLAEQFDPVLSEALPPEILAALAQLH